MGIWIGRHLGLRANLLFAQPELEGEVSSIGFLSDPDVWLLNADLMVRLPVGLGTGSLAPYLLGGFGVKRYSFLTRPTQNDPAASVGAGIEYRLSRHFPFGWSVEVRDFISPFRRWNVDDTQHDLVWTGGMTVNF